MEKHYTESHVSPNRGSTSFKEDILASWVPFLVLIAVYVFFMKKMKKDGTGLYGNQTALLEEMKKMNSQLSEISNKLDNK